MFTDKTNLHLKPLSKPASSYGRLHSQALLVAKPANKNIEPYAKENDKKLDPQNQFKKYIESKPIAKQQPIPEKLDYRKLRKQELCVELYFEEIFTYLMNQPDFKLNEKKMKNLDNDTRHLIVRSIMITSETNFSQPLKEETVEMAIYLLDQYCYQTSPLRSQLNLIAKSALFIAAKYEEIYPPSLSSFQFSESFSNQDIMNMEGDIIKLMNFQLIHISASQHLKNFNAKFSIPEKILTLAQIFIDICLESTLLSTLNSKECALCCVYLGFKIFNSEQDPLDYLKKISKNVNDLENKKNQISFSIKPYLNGEKQFYYIKKYHSFLKKHFPGLLAKQCE